MVKTRDELLSSIRTAFGDNTDDAALSVIEDITDTFTDLENKAKGDGKDWKAEAERIDKEWRQKYHDRFFNPTEKEEEDPLDAGSPAPKVFRFEDLFK